jgi:pyrroloquinoline-quinone synthase
MDDLRVYAAQYYHFEAELPTLLSAVHSRCEDSGVRQDILDNLWDEEHGQANHRALWLDFCEAVGLGRAEPEITRLLPTTQAMLQTYRTLCHQRTFQEGLAAVYAYEVQVPAVMIEKVRGLKDYFGITDEASLRFFEVHSVLDEDHSDREREGILKHTSPGLEPSVEAALQQALDGWWGFLDGVMDSRSSSAAN